MRPMHKPKSNHRTRSGITLLVFINFFLLISCNSGLKADEYRKWVTNQENGLHCNYQLGDFSFDVQFKPWEYVWLSQGDNQMNREQAQRELGGLQYYSLTISTSQLVDIIKYGATTPEEVQQNLYYYSYLFQYDISLLDNGKKLPCVLYHFERSGDLRTSRTIELGFETNGLSKEAIIVIQSQKISALPVQIKIKKENIPALI